MLHFFTVVSLTLKGLFPCFFSWVVCRGDSYSGLGLRAAIRILKSAKVRIVVRTRARVVVMAHSAHLALLAKSFY